MKTTNDILKNNLSDILSRFNDITLSTEDTHELDEWMKCKEDFFYFLHKYIPLDLPGADNTFTYHNGQELTIRTLMTDHYVIVLKSRQIGITTAIRAYCAWLTIFYNNYSIGVISKKGPDATAFVRKTIKIIEDLPPFLRPEFDKKTEQQYILANGSLLMAEAVSPSQPENALRSNPIAFLIIDEGAFIAKIKEALSGLLPTTVTVQQAAKAAGIPYGVLFISTPNKTQGTGEWFFKQYQQAVINNGLPEELSKGSYKAIRLHWKDLDGPFNEEWYMAQCKVLNYNKEDIAQEVDCAFLPVVKNGLIKKDRIVDLSNNIRPPAYKVEVIDEIKKDGQIPKHFGDLYIFDETLPQTRHERRFMISIDTATSNGMSTFSSIVAIDYDTNEQVLEYVGKLSTYDYPKVVFRALEEIGDNLFIIIERNTIGESIVGAVFDHPRWKNKMYHTIVKDKNGKVVRQVAGIETHGASKPLFVEAVTEFFDENIEKIYGERSILQITTVDVLEGKLVGTPNDLIMCYAFLAYVKKNNLVRFNKLNPSQEGLVLDSELAHFSEEDVLNYLYDKDGSVRNRINRIKRDKYNNVVDFLNND